MTDEFSDTLRGAIERLAGYLDNGTQVELLRTTFRLAHQEGRTAGLREAKDVIAGIGAAEGAP